MYTLRNFSMPCLSDDAAVMLDAFAVTLKSSHGGYLASWHLSMALGWGDDLDAIAGESGRGNEAMTMLQRSGLVEPVPGLGSRYWLTQRGAIVVLLRIVNQSVGPAALGSTEQRGITPGSTQ